MRRARMVPTVSACSFYSPLHSQFIYRCTANAKDLDGGGGRRCREHTELLVESFGLRDLWEEYGLVGDVIVCCC